MSGGAFNYAYMKVMDFAQELRERIQEDKDNTEYPCPADEIALLESVAETADRMAEIMKAVEWYKSGDGGLTSLFSEVLEAFENIKKPQFHYVPRDLNNETCRYRITGENQAIEKCHSEWEAIEIIKILKYDERYKNVALVVECGGKK